MEGHPSFWDYIISERNMALRRSFMPTVMGSPDSMTVSRGSTAEEFTAWYPETS